MNLHSYTNMTPTSTTGTQMFHPDWGERVRWAFWNLQATKSYDYMHPPPYTHTHTQVDPGSDSSESSNSGVGEAREIPFNQDPSLHAVDALAFDSALRELRGVLGEDVSEDLLRDLLLAADMDTNRAVNYYFNTQGSI